MSDARGMWQGFVVFVVCCIAGVVLAFVFGMATDTMQDGFFDAGIYEINDSEWSGFYDGTTAPMINILYMTIYLVPLIGLVVLILSAFKRYWRGERR